MGLFCILVQIANLASTSCIIDPEGLVAFFTSLGGAHEVGGQVLCFL